ncbi:MAG: ATP-binding cassette domain-containing protein [Paludibacter sp.]|nr:ATP-binding cassette domain-containing protein [Paludibacter sp.]
MRNPFHKATFFGILFLILLWQGIAIWVGMPELFPSVTDLIIELLHLLSTSRFYVALLITIARGITGFVLAMILAFTLALIALHHDFWKNFFHPLIVTIRSIPVISLVLIALLWISPQGLPVYIAFFTMFPILYQAILSGLEHTDDKLIEMAIVFRKKTLQRFLHIYLPSALTLIFSGMSTAMGFGWRAVIIGEVMAGPVHGIGTSMKQAQVFIDMRELLAWTVVAVLVSFVFDLLMKAQSTKILKRKLIITKTIQVDNHSASNLKGFEISDLTKKFNNLPLINGFSAQFSNEAIYLMKSASGSGKTTLMKIIAGICPYENGFVNLNKKYIISYSFQDLRLIPWLNVVENIAFALPSYPAITRQIDAKINDIISLLELSDKKHKLPTELSGGEQQRVALARALILTSDILLLDEPLNGLGMELKIKTIRTIENWTASYKPIILWATHEDVGNYLEKATYTLQLTD